MKDKITDQQFIDAVKNNFEQSVEHLDAGTTLRLNSIRSGALESAPEKQRQWLLYPAGAFVTACLALMLFTLIQPATSTSSFKAEDIEMLSTSEDLDIYEDLEFYQWLEEYEISS